MPGENIDRIQCILANISAVSSAVLVSEGDV